MPSPVKSLKAALLTLAALGGFPLDSVDDWTECIWFELKWPLFVWCCLMSVFWYIIPIVVAIILLQVHGVWFGAAIFKVNHGHQNSTVSLFGVPPGDVNTFYWSLVFSVVQVLAILITFTQMAPTLTTLNSDIDNLAPYTMSIYDIKRITARTFRRLGFILFAITNVIIMVSFTTYHMFPKVKETARIFVSATHTFFILVALFPPPVLASFLLSTQYVEFVAKMVKNYRTKILPRTDKARLMRRTERASLPEAIQYKNPVYKAKTKYPPPAYRSKSPMSKTNTKHRKKDSLPSYHSSVESDPYVMSDVLSIIDYGFDTVKIVNELNLAFGGFLLFETLFSFTYAVIMIYLTQNFIPAIWTLGIVPVLFKVAFAWGTLASGILFIYRLCVIFNLGQKVENEMIALKKNLQAVCILKFNRLRESQMFELSVLLDRTFDHRTLQPRSYFNLNNKTLGILFVFLVTILTSIYSVRFVETTTGTF
ncbi:uncharacterized protein LOC131887441 [Tigriopus californicus]|uniref:uncharacterized protein LOC131887441 n=1 Tax=Tigriopus californicus TaxID=6832 RepID=UPI0027D9DB92|nr:uncharacterized protein LOC131887441 [Tigriopus californicus]